MCWKTPRTESLPTHRGAAVSRHAPAAAPRAASQGKAHRGGRASWADPPARRAGHGNPRRQRHRPLRRPPGGRDRHRSRGHSSVRRTVSARGTVSLRDHRGRGAEGRRTGDRIPTARAAGRRTAVALSAAAPTSRPYPGLRLLLFLAAVALGWNVDGYRLLDPDEGRNAEVAREMAHTNDYLVPHLDGLPYLDKPIVYFAAAAALMELLGPTETAARLPAYAATLATIGLLVAFARRRWGADAGWLAGIAYATMLLPLVYARTAIFDSTLTLCTTAAILWFFEERPVLAWAAMAAGALTKGPLAIALPLLVLVPHALATGLPLRRLFSWRAVGAFALIALPWFIAVSIRVPAFPYYVVVRETLQRVTTGTFHRTAPFWYYFPIVPVAAFPWIVPALARARGWRATCRARGAPVAREPLPLASRIIIPLAF